MRHDVDRNAVPGAHICRPAVFHDPVGAAVEIGVLCEVIEGVAWPVEAGSDIMAAIISRAAIRTSRASLAGAEIGRLLSAQIREMRAHRFQ